jgi:two-component system CheB/CheR fusion protein
MAAYIGGILQEAERWQEIRFMAMKKRALKSKKVRPMSGNSRRQKTRASADPEFSPGASFPIVGIGASAGGLEALSGFLKALPAQTGMGVVVVQHLAPEHESALTQLLSKATAMPVLEVSDGLAMKRNHVYVIPPNKSMTLQDGALRLIPRERASVPHHPIDEFLAALAREQKAAAIGVILSGSGSDGTLGLRAIKSEGGVTFVQDPKTAAWPAMPASAISAGVVDFVLTPAGIAAELARISRHPYLLKNGAAPEGDGLEKIYMLLAAATGVDFRLYKQPTVSRRVGRRMALQKMGSLGEYVRFLRQHADELKALADDFFIHVTGFFRDVESFQALRKYVFPKMHLNRRADAVRVWVPGCSTGEEVYSLVMLLLESLTTNSNQTRIQMFGTDISESAVQRARVGIYSQAAVRGVSPARLRRFFGKVEHGYQINKEVRGLCVFARHDLATDPPFSKLDLISCRNVLIYAGPQLQNRILSAFQYALKPGGLLFLGKSEAISAYSDIFAAEDRNHKIFSRRPKAGAAAHFEWWIGHHTEETLAAPRVALPGVAGDFQKQAEQVLLQRYAPPALVIDSDLHVLHFQGDIGPYLALSTGPPTVQLLKMLRPQFVVNLRSAISKAKKEGATITTRPVHVLHGGQTRAVRLEISPLRKDNTGRPDFLVVFKELAPAEPPPSKGQVKRGKNEGDSRLQRELAATREYLSSLIGEHETAQEEMKAAHEEILSSSEELQSTNEELETAKEELQSSNEELQTLNEELLHRNLDLGVLTNDLNNLLVGVDIPVVVLDGSLHIRRFTPVAGKLLNLIEADVGRPFSDIAPTLEISDWDALFAEVTNRFRPVEREVKDKSGRWHSLRIRPYRTSDNKIDGVILILLDTDVIKRELEESHDYARMLLESAEQAIVAANAHGCIVLINSATEKMFGHTRSELLGKRLDLLLPPSTPADREQQGRRKDGTRFPLEVSLSTIDQAGVRLTVAFMTDITEQHRLERLSETYRGEIRALAAQLITAQEEERRRVSRELHDSLCQKLASLAFDVENLAVALPSPAATRTRLRKLRERAIKVSEEARHIAYELHPSVLDDLGLVVSLQSLCDEFSKAEKIQVEFAAGKLPDLISQQVASGLYRIAQESLQNVAKHAKARHLSVALEVHDGALVLSLTDDGVGFVPQAVKGKGGLGLVGIGERARIIGGALSIGSKPGNGTRISVRVPLE